MKMQCVGALQKSALPLLGTEEMELCLESRRVVDSSVKLILQSSERQKGEAGSCYPRHLCVSWIRAWPKGSQLCLLAGSKELHVLGDKGRTGGLPSEQRQPAATGREGAGCSLHPEKKIKKKRHHQPGDSFIASSRWDVTLPAACQLKRGHRCL